jgi:hypothetical protein
MPVAGSKWNPSAKETSALPGAVFSSICTPTGVRPVMARTCTLPGCVQEIDGAAPGHGWGKGDDLPRHVVQTLLRSLIPSPTKSARVQMFSVPKTAQ